MYTRSPYSSAYKPSFRSERVGPPDTYESVLIPNVFIDYTIIPPHRDTIVTDPSLYDHLHEIPLSSLFYFYL